MDKLTSGLGGGGVNWGQLLIPALAGVAAAAHPTIGRGVSGATRMMDVMGDMQRNREWSERQRQQLQMQQQMHPLQKQLIEARMKALEDQTRRANEPKSEIVGSATTGYSQIRHSGGQGPYTPVQQRISPPFALTPEGAAVRKAEAGQAVDTALGKSQALGNAPLTTRDIRAQKEDEFKARKKAMETEISAAGMDEDRVREIKKSYANELNPLHQELYGTPFYTVPLTERKPGEKWTEGGYEIMIDPFTLKPMRRKLY